MSLAKLVPSHFSPPALGRIIRAVTNLILSVLYFSFLTGTVHTLATLFRLQLIK